MGEDRCCVGDARKRTRDDFEAFLDRLEVMTDNADILARIAEMRKRIESQKECACE